MPSVRGFMQERDRIPEGNRKILCVTAASGLVGLAFLALFTLHDHFHALFQPHVSYSVVGTVSTGILRWQEETGRAPRISRILILGIKVHERKRV